MFLELLESENSKLEEDVDAIVDFLLDSCETEEDVQAIKEEYDLDDETAAAILESIVKRVSADGTIRKTLNRKIRSRRATATTGMSKSQLRLRARKSVKTKKKNPKTQRVALRKRRKALRRRKQYGLK
jgi:hypothetical protein